MMLQFEEVYQAVREGRPASMTLEAEGTTYTRNFRPRERLILLGGGHVAQPLCRYAAELGFAVTVVDDRPAFANRELFPDAQDILCDAFPAALHSLNVNEQDYVAVITRGHRHDADCLRTILPGPFPRYLGMIGSKRRVAGLFQLLKEEGFPGEALERIHAPIGLPIQALTTREIAVSILAELIQCRRQDTARRSASRILVAEDADLPTLEFLARSREPRLLLVVLETSGSTPVKSGAMMAADRSLKTVGTIGGGCGEHAALMQARRLLGTDQCRCIQVDMSNDVAEEEGMVCGGRMTVLVQAINE